MLREPKIGDTVHFFAPKFGDSDGRLRPVPAIVTLIEYSSDCEDTRHVALTAFPPGAVPVPLQSVQHRSFFTGAAHDLQGFWDWPSAEAA